LSWYLFPEYRQCSDFETVLTATNLGTNFVIFFAANQVQQLIIFSNLPQYVGGNIPHLVFRLFAVLFHQVIEINFVLLLRLFELQKKNITKS
jgi:hypothetical protein